MSLFREYVVTALLLMVMVTGLNAQNPSYLCELRTDIQVDARTFEFDIYLLRTGTIPFEYSSMQFGINMNPGARNGGDILVSLVDGTSELNANQVPAALRFSFDAAENCIIMTGTPPPGAGSGTIISNSGFGTRVGRIRLSNTVDFGTVRPDLTWSFDDANGYATKINAYVGSTAGEVTVTSSHTTTSLVNAILNQALPEVFNITGGGSYCSGGAGVPVGLSGSESGVTYTLLRGAETVATLPGTGSSLSFGNQTVTGVYEVTATNEDGTQPMNGTVTVTVDPLPTTSAITGSATPACSSTGNVYSVTATAGSSYAWTLPAGSTIT
ncbi:MAG: hypothetical protein WAV93_04410, partial [Bacteroidales bacterium]